jgi:hypothetical protein
MPKFTRNKKLELILLYIYFAISGAILLILRADLNSTIVVYAGIPAFYFAFQNKNKYLIKNLLETLVFSIPVVAVVDYIASMNKAWFVPSILSWRLFGIVSIEMFMWGFFYVFFIINFYEYFFDRSIKKTFTQNTKKFFYILIPVLLLFTYRMLTNNIITIPYFYSILSLIFIIVTIVGLFKYKNLYVPLTLISI